MVFRQKNKQIIIALLLISASLFVAACDTEDAMKDDTIIDYDSMDDDSMMEEADVTFTLTGENFKFLMNGEEAPELRVNVGDKVKIEFTSTDGFHDWVVDEFDAATSRVQTGETTSVTFVADQAGTFEYYCSVGSHRANGMFGNLIVE